MNNRNKSYTKELNYMSISLVFKHTASSKSGEAKKCC